MKPFIPYTLLAAAAACGFAFGQAYTTPVGYVTINCPANSDTIVGLPLRIPAVSAAALSADPEVTGSTATLTFGSAAFTESAFANTHYVKFVDGPAAGKWFTATANTATTITVDLNGASLAAVSGNRAEVVKFWTLAELFNPAQSTSDPATTGNAIVASTSILPAGRRTEILIPNLTAAGINIAPATNYYIHDGIWKKQGSGNTSFNNDQLWPDTYFIIRHPAAVSASTNYVCVGEVETGSFNIALGTQAAVRQDNFVALPRPVDVTLSQLALGNTSAFTSSTSILPAGRRDELLVYDNAAAARNKAPSANYYFHDGIWKKQGSGNTDVGADTIPAGFGFIIRKYQSGTGATADWNNTSSY